MLDVTGDANVTGNASVTGNATISTGNLTISTGYPALSLKNTNTDGWGNQIGFFDNSGNQRHIIYDDFGPAGGGSSSTKGHLIIHPGYGSGGAANILQVDGRVQIGSAQSGSTLPNAQFANYQLSVDGQIVAKELIVQVMSWSDTVFSNEYRLRSLPEVESYVKANGHLPEVPDECDVMGNGVSVGMMNATLLKKVEELTLYAVQQQKEIEELKVQLNSIIK